MIYHMVCVKEYDNKKGNIYTYTYTNNYYSNIANITIMHCIC